MKCAIEEFTALLIHFLGGDEEQTQRRWWLSLRESHARFRIGAAERGAWLQHMFATLEAAPVDNETRSALKQFFERSSGYIVSGEAKVPEHVELAARWSEKRVLDDTMTAIAEGRDDEAMMLASRFAGRPSIFVRVLAQMVHCSRASLTGFVLDALERGPSIGTRRFGGRALVRYAPGAGCIPVVTALLRGGT